MSVSDETVDSLIRGAVSGSLASEPFLEACEREAVDLATMYNAVALTVAKRFLEDGMSFGDADACLNALHARANLGTGVDNPFLLPKPAHSIFLAFDEGEYDHGDGADPVAKYTRPRLEKVLRRVSSHEG